MTSPTKLTLTLLRKQGFTVAITERWNQFAKVRQDLFGFIDVLAVKGDTPGVLGVQCTTKHNMLERVKKITKIANTKPFLEAGNTIFVIGWVKEGKNWQHEIRQIKLADLELTNEVSDEGHEDESTDSNESADNVVS